MGDVTFITGGCKSGKSRYALDRASGYKKKIFIATAEPLDEEMRVRIRKHQVERGDDFQTIEEPVKLGDAVRTSRSLAEVVLIDCLTLWVNNLLYRLKDEAAIYNEIEEFKKSLINPDSKIIVVTNEVGMGIIPADSVSRRFMDIAGRVNQDIAKLADEAVFMVSGLPMVIKDSRKK